VANKFFYTVVLSITEKGGPTQAYACNSKEEVCKRIKERWPWEHFPWYEGHTIEKIMATFLAGDDSRHDEGDLLEKKGRLIFGHGDSRDPDTQETVSVFRHCMDEDGKMLY